MKLITACIIALMLAACGGGGTEDPMREPLSDDENVLGDARKQLPPSIRICAAALETCPRDGIEGDLR